MSRLQENVHRIIDNAMKMNNIPGAAVAVINNNEVILSQGFGRTNVQEWGSPVSSETLFRIASVSKLFTGTLMMMLVEKGLIDLDQPVQYYVPWFTTADPELSKLITIRMLLTHTSGLPTGENVSTDHKEAGLYHYMKEVVPTLPILFHPGSAYSYGNHAVNIAGFVAEQVTNKPFASLMQEMLFNRLEMEQTTYDPLKAMTYPVALPHKKDRDGNPTISHQFYDNSGNYPSYYAFSSVKDLCKFAMMHLQEGVYKDRKILSCPSIKEIRTQQAKWYTLTDAGCGISFFKETKDGIERYWHYGQYSNEYSSQFILVPDKGIAVIALANGENIFQAGYEIVDELLKEESHTADNGLEKGEYTETSWTNFEGTYLHSYYGLFDIYHHSGKGFMRYEEHQYELIHHQDDIYYVRDENEGTLYTVGFPSPTAEQTIKCIVVNSKACPEFNQVYTPDRSDWQDWEGTFSNGKESYEVAIEGESLMIKDLQNEKVLIGKAIDRHQFLTKEYGLVNFIEIHGVINLEFDYAWRYPKQT